MSKVEAMAAHIEELGRAHDLKISYTHRGGKGRAWRSRRIVHVGPIKSEITYLVALHEIAHVAGHDQSSRHRRIVHEIAAWEWAIATCRSGGFPLTRRMREKISRSLASYVSSYYWRRNTWLPTRDRNPEMFARMVRLLELGRGKGKTLPYGLTQAFRMDQSFGLDREEG